MIDRTTERSYIKIAAGFLPKLLAPLVGRGGLQLGPIPAGTPVSLLANLNPLGDEEKVFQVIARLDTDLRQFGSNTTDEQARRILSNALDPLLGMSKCPDLVVNRGHYFGNNYYEPGEPTGTREPGLSDSDKRALIESLKTF